MINQVRVFYPYVSPNDPCPPITVKTYVVPPEMFVGFQMMNLPQFSPYDALRVGTLWPCFYSPYEGSQT